MKKKGLKAPITTAIWCTAFAASLTLGIVAQNVTAYYDQVICDFLGVIGGELVVENNDGLDKKYNKFRFDSVDELNKYETKLVRDMGGEGYVLLKNDTVGQKGLPLKTTESNKTKVSIFSHSSVDILAGGTGSGTGSLDVDLKQAFEAQNFEVNEKLWNFYKSGNGKGYVRGTGSTVYGHGPEDWRINECPLSALQNESGLLESTKNTTALFVISRTGGEGRDLARYMGDYTSIEEDKNKHYLEPDSVELGIIDYLNKNFDNVILVVNTNNVFELGWVNNYQNIKSVLWAPGGGGQTANSIVDVISGKVNPSGHLVDTIAYDAFSSPAMQNFGDIQYTINGQPALYSGTKLVDVTNTNSQNNGLYGVSYDEGIYVGYKYYETRYFDKIMNQGNAGDYNYDNEVQYPFGYGLSYTNFEWSNYTQVNSSTAGEITVKVDVKNVGSVAGKEVVGVYLNTPYTDYDKANHIEKSAVSLVGYAKTKVLEPNETVTVQITVNEDDFKSYDDVNEKTYILEDGKYLLTAAKDAHKATNNFLKKASASVSGDTSFVGEITKNSSSSKGYSLINVSKSGANVSNHFDDANYIDRSKYLTRNNWVDSFPKTHGSQQAKVKSYYSEKNGYVIYEEITQALYAKLKAAGTAEAANSPIKDEDVAKLAGSFGVNSGIELIDIRGKAYDDVDWDKVVSQMTKEEMGYMLNLSGYTTAKATSIQKPGTSDLDGPMGLNLMATHEPFSIAYPAEVTIAASWNVEMSKAHGDAIAQDGLRSNVNASGWYGPGVNIHRTPFSGRNFEYYSEDSYMTGTMATGAIRAAAENGMYSFIKHFALNDQEDHRDQNGISSWCNEQTMREIYFKPFQLVFECGDVETKYYEGTTLKTAKTPVATATMTSFNRIGATWAGGDYRLLTEVLRNEWNFKGIALTDYSGGAEGYMHTEQMIRAGGDVQLSQYGVAFSKWTLANQYYAKQAMKHVNFTVANSNAMNGYSHGAKVGSAGFPIYYFILIGLYAIAGTVGVIGTIRSVKAFKRKKEVNIEEK